jgi:hypothetical protein
MAGAAERWIPADLSEPGSSSERVEFKRFSSRPAFAGMNAGVRAIQKYQWIPIMQRTFIRPGAGGSGWRTATFGRRIPG